MTVRVEELHRQPLFVQEMMRCAAESPFHIRGHPQAIRMTLLAALVFQRTQEVTDALVTLLIQLIHRIGKRKPAVNNSISIFQSIMNNI